MKKGIISSCGIFFLFLVFVMPAQAAEPWLYMTHGDVIGDKSTVYAGIGYDKKVLLTNNTGGVFRFQNGTLNTVGNGGSGSSVQSMFISSTGTIYISWPGGIWRSINNGDSWTKTLTFPQSDGRTISFTEDDQGNVYAGQYSLLVSSGAAILYKTSDNGASWMDITPSAFATFRHVHYVYWCPFRNKLFVAIGDKGINAVYASDDHGSTFSLWGSAEQTVAIISDQDYVYGVRDTAGSRFIWRAGNDGQQTNVYSLAQNAIGWWGHRDEFGNIIFAISRDGDTQTDIVASSNQGASWNTYYTKMGKYLDRFALPSFYYDNWDGFYYGGGGLFVGAKWRLYPEDAQFKIAADGIDYLNDGIVNPWKTFAAANYLPLDKFSSVMIDSYSAAGDDSLAVRSDNLVLNGNSNSFSSSSAFTGFSDNLEGSNPFSSFTQTNGSVAISSSSSPHSGSKALIASSTAANAVLYANKSIGPYDAGSTVWMSGWVKVPNNITSSGYFDIFRLWNQSGGASLIVRVLNNKNISVKLENVGRTYSVLQSNEPFTVFPINQWVKIKVKVKVSDTSGTITIWQDDRIIMQALGLDTLLAGKPWNQARWGVYANQSDALVYWDDLALGNSDPDRNAAVNIIGDNNTVKNFIFSDGLLSIDGSGNSILNNSFVTTSSSVVAAAGRLTGQAFFAVNDLIPESYYEVLIDHASSTGLISGDACNGSICSSDASGSLSFSYAGSAVAASLLELKQYFPSDIYYVDSISGDDGNSGHAPNQAWKTVAKVNSSLLHPGDRILFKKGQTWHETLTVPGSGTAEQPIIFSAYGEGAKPRITAGDIVNSWTLVSPNVWSSSISTRPLRTAIDGVLGTAAPDLTHVDSDVEWFWSSSTLYLFSQSDPNSLVIEAGKRSNAVNTNGKSNIMIDGLAMDLANGSSGAGVWIGGIGANSVSINNCDIKWNRHGIVFYTTDQQAGHHSVSNCEIHHNDAHGIFSNAGSDGSDADARTAIKDNSVHDNKGFGIFVFASYWLIDNNSVFNNGNHQVAPGYSGIHIYGGEVNAPVAGAGDFNIIRNNIVYGTLSLGNDGSGISADIYADYNEIYGNTVFSNDGPGVTLFSNSGNKVIGNTSYNNCLNTSGEIYTRGEIRVSGISSKPESDFQISGNLTHATQSSTPAIYVNAYAYDQNPDISGNVWFADGDYWYNWNSGTGDDLGVWNDLTGVGTDFNYDPQIF